MKKHFLLFFSVFFSVTLLSQALWAKVYIDIRSPSFRKFPIALAPFTGSGPPTQEMRLEERARDILREDLEISGFFDLITPSTPPEKTGKSPAKAGEGNGPESLPLWILSKDR